MTPGIHVAIIMDGNGRWASEQNLPRWRGHVAGVESIRDTVRAAPGLGIDTLTVYAFSADNWKRPRGEVRRLFALLREYCIREREELLDQGVRLSAIGRRDRIPRRALAALEETEAVTAHRTTLHLRLAIDYSARFAITDAVASTLRQVKAGTLEPNAISPELIDREVTGGVAPPDLLIRTAGECRLSDFLLWELAYAELWFTPVLWPDFRRDHLAAALDDFSGRERRFGALGTESRRLAG